MGAAEIRQPRDHHTRVGDRLLKRCQMDAGIAGRLMRQGRQRVAIGLREILSRDSATWSAGNTVSRALDYRIGLTTISRPSTSGSCAQRIRGARGGEFEQTCGNRSRRPVRTLAGSG